MQIPTITIENVPNPLPEGVSVLDVREPDEWAGGHIEGAVHIPLCQVVERVGEVQDLAGDGQVLVVCKVGGRSAQAVAYLQTQGVQAINLDGGMLDWHAAGRPTV